MIYALGNFDGVHLGHKAVLAAAADLAERLNTGWGVATFTPHPRRFFQPDAPPFLLMSEGVQAATLRAQGAQTIARIPFDADLVSMTPDVFVTEVLLGQLKAQGVVVGSDFCFGKGRSGTAQTLIDLGTERGFAVEIVEPIGDGEKFGSSRIRAALRIGDVATANALLGHPWQIGGVVQHGDKRGRTIGFPTANLDLGDLVRPQFGVYAARTHLADGRSFMAAVNIGQRPTVGGTVERLEAHLIGFDGDLYDQPIGVDILDFVRPEQKFAGLDALTAQIALDVQSVSASF